MQQKPINDDYLVQVDESWYLRKRQIKHHQVSAIWGQTLAFKFDVVLINTTHGNIPWIPEVFLACGGNFRCWPKADTSSAVGRSGERRRLWQKPETGNRARKVSGTQGNGNNAIPEEKYHCIISYCFIWEDKLKKLGLRASSSVPNTSKQPALCFYLFSVFATRHEELTLVFDILLIAFSGSCPLVVIWTVQIW